MTNLLMISSVTISVVTGICTSLLASVFFALIVFLCRPKIKISDKICVQKEEGYYYFEVKVINVSHFLLTSVNVNLYIKDRVFDRMYKVEDIPNIIKSKNLKDKDKSFAVRYKFFTDQDEIKNIKDNKEQLLFVFDGESSIYKAKVSEYRFFKAKDILEGYKFEEGMNLGVV